MADALKDEPPIPAKRGHRFDLELVDAGDKDHIDLGPLEPRFPGRGDAAHHVFDIAAARDAAVFFRIERVQGDVEPVEPGRLESGGQGGQKRPVRGQGDFLDSGNGLQLFDQNVQVFFDQRLAAGQADLGQAERGRFADDGGDLLVG